MYRFAQVVNLRPLPRPEADAHHIQLILSTVFSITGAIAFLIMTLAGMRYVMSRGNPQSTAQAQRTIIYGAVGLVVSMSAFAIVTFVIGNL